MSYKVCESINTIDKYFDDDSKTPEKHNSIGFLNMFFPGSSCNSDEEKIISGFILLLSLFNDIDDKNIDGDKLVEYGILWLSYKLNQKKQYGTTKLDDFYIKNIETNSCYKENISNSIDSNGKINMGVIDKKIKSMKMNIKDISNFYDLFKSLCNVYSELDPKKTQCKTCLENAEEFFEKHEKLKNDFDITEEDSYSQLWLSLSKDYKNFEKKYNSVKCEHVSSLVACPRSSVTKNTLITIAIIFVAASILLGVSYKYSLFGFRKRSQKQHLREMLKK
ncbi:PIR protein [Plasmodium yoelii]|nr:PIR protein [Plasmodium yoelii]CDS44342.1 YIR protein [Plasmodium yoelii]VTZ79201.1 PIR protein [Plasmodium yoelii]|eukprot:XP_022813103.2 PIR protein [Plasmodium yoelii]